MHNEPGYRRETIIVLESHIDHLSGEEVGHAFDRLMESGALDVLWLPGIMKKNRPGGALRVICTPDKEDAVLTAFFRHTHTLGIRRQPMERLVLPRENGETDLDGSRVAVKEYILEGERYVRVEHEALAYEASAKGLGIPALRFKKRQ